MEPALRAIGGRLWRVTSNNLKVYRHCTWLLRSMAVLLVLLCSSLPSQAQTFRFNLRAEPDIIPANGISTTSILVQVQNQGGSGITAAPIVRFLTTRGSIESQARLTGGVARVLLRSATTPGTAVVTAFVGTAREEVTVEFSDDESGLARFLVVQAPYVAYGTDRGIITASGKSVFDFGDTHLESDVRLDVDLYSERIWAEGGAGHVIIRHGHGAKAHELRGDRLYYDMRRRRGVMRRVDTKDGPVRQEFMDSDFRPIPENEVAESPADENDKDKPQNNKASSDKSKAATKSKPTGLAQPEPVHSSEASPTVSSGAKAITPVPLDQVPTTDGTNVADKTKAILGTSGAVTVQQPTENADPAPELPAHSPTTLGEAPEPRLQPISTDGTRVQVFKATGTAFGITPITIADALQTGGANSEAAAPVVNSASATPKPRILTALNTETNPPKGSAGEQLEDIPNYQPLTPDTTEVKRAYKLNEPLPPQLDEGKGYWITARQVRVYPHDKIQFQHATVFFVGRKLFSMPLYVTSLSSAFNPATDMASFNSAGGLTLNVPYYYQASPHGTGTLFLQHAPSNGFAAERSGFALALEQEYWLSNQSQGHLLVDQIGHDWNLNWEHKLQFSPSTSGALYLDMPGHKSQYLRASLLKEFKDMQVGFESFYSRPEGQVDNLQGQFFARLRPRPVGHSQWTYTLAANALAQKRFTALVPVHVPVGGGIGGIGGDTGGGIGLPGQNPHPGVRSLRDIAYLPITVQTIVLQNRPLYGQTFNATLSAPTYTLWKGASLQASLMGVAYNYTDGRRGVAPGVSLGLQQNLGRSASMQLNYDYQRGGINLFGADSTNLLTGSFSFNLKRKFAGSTLLSKSLGDGALYGLSSLDYYVSPMWRVGLFTDYVRFANAGDFLNYGLSLGRALGQREVTLNWDHDRNRIYFEFGGLHY